MPVASLISMLLGSWMEMEFSVKSVNFFSRELFSQKKFRLDVFGFLNTLLTSNLVNHFHNVYITYIATMATYTIIVTLVKH